MRHLIASVIFAAFAVPAPEASAYENDITDHADIAMIVAINHDAEMLKTQIEACISNGGERRPCHCAAAYQIEDLRASIRKALTIHPEWQRRTLYIPETGDSQMRSLTMNFGRIPYIRLPQKCY